MTNQLLHSLKWSALGEIASKVLPPLFYIITARLLTPEDFGVVATSAMVVAFASILWEAGLSKALIQNQEFDIRKMSNIVLYTNMVLSVLLYIVLFFSSDTIASFFHDERVADVLQISGLSLIIGSLMSVQTALLQKDFGFKKLFYSRFVGAIIPGIVSVALAYYGYGYWALVYGTIASMILQALILWKISPWRPSYGYDLAVAKKMFHFSKWVLLSALLSWFFIWGDIFVLGFFFTSHQLGLYRTGNYFVGAVIGLVTAPIVPVMYSYFSKIQHDKESVKRALLLSSKVVSFFVLPIGVGLYIVQNPLSDLIFGEKWIGIASVIGILALTHSLAWIIGLNVEAYRAIGRPEIETKVLLYSSPIYLFVYIITAQIRFDIFLYGRLLLVFFGILMHIYFSNVLLGINFVETIGNIKYLIISIFLSIIVNAYQFSDLLFIYHIGLLISSLILYITFIFYFDRNFLKQLYIKFYKKGKY
jgi:PST family polysaccharide transporter